MLRLFATPKTRPIFPVKTLSVIKTLRSYKVTMVRRIANRWQCRADASPVPLTDTLALQPYNAMISRHDDPNCSLLRVVRFDIRDFNLIGTRNSVAVGDIESFSLTDAS
jgi:hypothetical protein